MSAGKRLFINSFSFAGFILTASETFRMPARKFAERRKRRARQVAFAAYLFYFVSNEKQ